MKMPDVDFPTGDKQQHASNESPLSLSIVVYATPAVLASRTQISAGIFAPPSTYPGAAAKLALAALQRSSSHVALASKRFGTFVKMITRGYHGYIASAVTLLDDWVYAKEKHEKDIDHLPGMETTHTRVYHQRHNGWQLYKQHTC
ncbi:hypothetical protein IF1G_05878 [Cordyceps javanica]|uniref:Uncharacterized protein n=1 Tax=Cordyceps javanica TaxID=43265 RepID=A0A545UZJ4_9HYPO|nr:hypothetical protein IF1G_05878 [Cordyceps javanica]